ncbi:hypothetical protein [Shewanella seohaensis]|uniref:Reelin domain-containing protein n=1 Tax=Shewanella seohaensis TaxID=755175 RepID=A0ABV4VXV2_9GAMM
MKFATLFLFLFLTSIKAWSCSFPMSGAQYDTQIEVVSIDNKGAFKFIVPAKMEGLDELEVNLGYSPINSDFKFMRESKRLDFKIFEGKAVGTFTVEKKEGLLPFLHVMWWPERPGLCGVAAVSEFIAASDT